MQFDKQFVLDELKKEDESAKAQQALAELPEKIDHEQHAALLEKFGLDPGKLAARACRARNRQLVSATSVAAPRRAGLQAALTSRLGQCSGMTPEPGTSDAGFPSGQ